MTWLGSRTLSIVFFAAAASSGCDDTAPSELRRGPVATPNECSDALSASAMPMIDWNDRVDDGAVVVDGDIALSPTQIAELGWDDRETERSRPLRPQLLASPTSKNDLWPNGVVPYTIASSITSTQKPRIQQAIDHWQSKTAVRFVPRTNETSYVTFRYSAQGYAWANLGRQGGQQFVNLVENRWGVIVHELGHTLGFYHEHTRPDRDQHVVIVSANIRAGFEGNFSKYASGRMIGPYDIDSIMHYPSREFSANGRPTITRVGGGDYPTNYTELSAGDVAAVNQLYPPATPPPGTPPPATSTDETPAVPATSEPIVIDSDNAINDETRGYVKVGAGWKPSKALAGYHGTGFLSAESTPEGAAADAVVTFHFNVASPGKKTIEAWWPSACNASDRVTWEAVSADGKSIASVVSDQTKNASRWNVLGTWELPAGWNEIRLTRKTAAAGKVVIGDAIRVR